MGGRSSTPVIQLTGPRRNSYDVGPSDPINHHRMGPRGSTHSLPTAASTLHRSKNGLGVTGTGLGGRTGNRSSSSRSDFTLGFSKSSSRANSHNSRASNDTPFSNLEYESDFESDDDDKHNITLSNTTLTRMKLLRKKRDAMKDMEKKISSREYNGSGGQSPHQRTNNASRGRTIVKTPYKSNKDDRIAQERHRKFKQLEATHSQNSLSISRASSEDSGLSVKPNVSYRTRTPRQSPKPSPDRRPVTYGRVSKSQSNDRLNKSQNDPRRRNRSLDRPQRNPAAHTPRRKKDVDIRKTPRLVVTSTLSDPEDFTAGDRKPKTLSRSISTGHSLSSRRTHMGSGGSLNSTSRYSGVSTNSRRSLNTTKQSIDRTIDELISAMGTARVRSPKQMSSSIIKNIKPFPAPREGLQDSKDLLGSDDWKEQVEAIHGIVRLCTYHPDELSGDLHEVNLLMLKHARNLRSQVSRTAIQGYMHLFDSMKRQMEYDLDKIVPLLLNKSADTSNFIKIDCHNALDAMVEHVSPPKAIPAIIQEGVGHRNPIVRTTAARLLAYSVERMGGGRILSGQRDVTDRLLPAAAKLAQDANLDTRMYTKMIFLPLIQQPQFESMMNKMVPSNEIKNIQKFLDHLCEGRMIQDSARSKAAAGSRYNRTM